MIEVVPTCGAELAEPLSLLEESLREGEPVPEDFAESLREAAKTGAVEVLAARAEGRAVGVAVLSYRLSISAAGLLASIEDLYVRPDSRRQGMGRALLEAVEERCASRGVSYVEVQVEDEGAAAFYSAMGYEEEPGVRVLSRSYSLPDNGRQHATGFGHQQENLKPDA
jgi:GNAT superfamily N-acetyltransferase